MESTKRKIGTPRLKQAELVRNTWRITCEDGTTQDDLLDPAYWSIISTKLRDYDKIEVTMDDDSVYGVLLVKESGRNYAQVKVLEWHDLTDIEHIEDNRFEQFDVVQKGPHLKYCVIRRSDQEILQQGMKKHEAMKWLRDNIDHISKAA